MSGGAKYYCHSRDSRSRARNDTANIQLHRPVTSSRRSQRCQRLLQYGVLVDNLPLTVFASWWRLVGDSKPAGPATRAVWVSPFMSLISFIGELRILIFVAFSWCSEGSEQQPTLFRMVMFFCHLFISHIWFLGDHSFLLAPS